jgi:hypothetical protein
LVYKSWTAALIKHPSKHQLINSTLLHLLTSTYNLQTSIPPPTIIMKFTTAAAAASMAALASALPAETPFPRPGPSDVFRLMSLRSGTAVQYGNVQAKDGGLVINAPSENNKTCSVNGDRDNIVSGVNYASFSLDQEDGSLYLYSDFPSLRMYVDRSGMGQGVLRYTTGVQPIGKNQERGPFKINDDGDLVFAAPGLNGDIGFQACPNAPGGGFSIWLAGETTPGGNSDCTPFTMKALKEEDMKKCLYTSASA